MPSPGFPIIDFAPFLDGGVGRAECVAALRAATVRGGAFYLTNHGVSEALLAQLMALTVEFYALPFEERMRVAAAPGTSGAYQPRDRFNEAFLASTIRQPTPGIDYSLFGENRWPERPAGITESVGAFTDTMSTLAQRLLGACALGLDLPESQFDSLFGPAAVHGAQLRYYAPQRPGLQMLDEHSDPNALALIVQDNVGGLEGLVDGEWQPIPPVPGTIVCTIGEAMVAWSNHRIVASRHRVIHDKIRERFSLLYTLLPRLDAPMASFAPCCDAEHPSPFPPITFFEFLSRLFSTQTISGDEPAKAVDSPNTDLKSQ